MWIIFWIIAIQRKKVGVICDDFIVHFVPFLMFFQNLSSFTSRSSTLCPLRISPYAFPDTSRLLHLLLPLFVLFVSFIMFFQYLSSFTSRSSTLCPLRIFPYVFPVTSRLLHLLLPLFVLFVSFLMFFPIPLVFYISFLHSLSSSSPHLTSPSLPFPVSLSASYSSSFNLSVPLRLHILNLPYTLSTTTHRTLVAKVAGFEYRLYTIDHANCL